MSIIKNYVLIPFDKELQAELKTQCRIKWDADKKLWYAPNKRVYEYPTLKPFHITYYTVPYKYKDEAKSAGFKWDNDKKQWYASNFIINKVPGLIEKFNLVVDDVDDDEFAPDTPVEDK